MNQSTGRLSSVDGKISKNKISFDEYSKMFKEMQAGKIKKPVLYEKAENMLKSMKKSNRSTISRKQQEESDRKRSMKITSISDYQNEESITNRKLKSKRSSKSLDSQKSKKDNEQPKETALCECCLQRKSDFIILDCKHYICLRCINDLKIMTGIYNEEQINTIQCIVCDSTQEIDTLELLTKQDSLSMSQIIKSRSLSKRKSSQKLSQIIEKGQPKKTKVEKAKLVLDQLFKIQRSMMKCQMCPTKALQMQKEAEYECLNCNFVMCQDCRTKHKNHARFKNHAIIVYVDLETHQQKVENDRCIFHKELLKLFCVTCNYPLCMLCVEFEDDHKNHELRTLSKMLEDVNRNKDNRKREINEKLLPQVQSYIQSYKEFKFKLEQQRDGSFFLINIEIANIKIEGFQSIKKRLEYLEAQKMDYDLLEMKMIKIIDKTKYFMRDIDITEISQWDLEGSIFQLSQVSQIKKSINKLEFLPFQGIDVEKFMRQFQKSRILNAKGEATLINKDTISIFPKFNQVSLIYRLSDDGIGTRTFHKACDNKGPTIMFVKANNHYIFGAFNPMSYMSENIYLDSDEAFLFSLTRKQTIIRDNGFEEHASVFRPVKCEVRQSKSDKAIKLNEENYSPGFGESDISDLFISFKNPKKSYSLLGNVYKLPQGVKGDTFLAGQPTDWDIHEIEIFSVSF
eukprot:403339925